MLTVFMGPGRTEPMAGYGAAWCLQDGVILDLPSKHWQKFLAEIVNAYGTFGLWDAFGFRKQLRLQFCF